MGPHGYPVPKPAAPRTLGTLSIIFGSIVGAMSLFSLIIGKQVGAMMQTNGSQKAAFEDYMAEIHTVSMVQSGAMLVMSAALVYLGVGQRRYLRSAASASVKWGLVALVYLVAILIVQCVVVLPALDRFMEAISHGMNAQLPMGGIMKISVFFGLAFYAPFPIILMVTFRKPHILAAMDQPQLPVATVHRS
ncbi:MAG: hypothetical protein H6Q90_4222 [Deltaproteobacteria bacterium]|nr:hypothetical protein [Deltaproteobacteria bacterium]